MINGASIRPVPAWQRSDDVDQAHPRVFRRGSLPVAMAAYAAAIAFLAVEFYEKNVANKFEKTPRICGQKSWDSTAEDEMIVDERNSGGRSPIRLAHNQSSDLAFNRN